MAFNIFKSREYKDQREFGDLLNLAEARAKLSNISQNLKLEELTDKSGDILPLRVESDPESKYHSQNFRLSYDPKSNSVLGVFYHQCLTASRDYEHSNTYSIFRPSSEERIPIKYFL
jgi:hypothetical protein